MSLLSLYPSILVPILFEWSFDDEVCSVDSAACSKKHRRNILYSLSLGKVTNSRRLKKVEERYQWMILRQIELKCYYIPKTNNERFGLRMLTLLSRTSNLVMLEAYISGLASCLASGLASLISVHGIRTQSLKLYGDCTDSAIEDILTALQCSVLHLDLLECYGLTSALCPKIALLCPNLISFRSPIFAEHLPIHAASFINVPMHEVLDMMDCSSPNIGNKSTHLCTFESTTECNSSCVTISEKRYTLVSIQFQKFVVESEVPFLSLLMANVHSLQFQRGFGHKLALFSPIDKFVGPANRLRCFHVYYAVFDTASLIDCLKNCVHLVSVIMDDCVNVNDRVLLSLAEYCPKLEELTITSPFTDCAVEQFFVKATEIKSCYFGPSAKFNAALRHLIADVDGLFLVAMIKTIECFNELGRRYLRASAYCILGREVLSSLLKINPRLVKVEFSHCSKLDDGIIEALVSFCSALTCVNIAHCAVTAQCLVPLSRCQGLLQLSLPHMFSMNNSPMEQFLKSKPKLEKLVLNSNNGYTSKVLFMIANHCPALKHLNMAGINIVDSRGIVEVLKKCQQLICLDVRGCSSVKSDILPWLKLKGMRFLNIENTGITKSEMNQFVEETGFSCSCELLY